MKKFFSIIVVLLLSLTTIAQSVYVFQYDYTEEDGIKSKLNMSYNIRFVAIANGRLGYIDCTPERARDEWDKCCEDAIFNIDNNIVLGTQYGYKKKFWSPVPQYTSYSYLAYCDEYTTSTKTTYRKRGASSILNQWNWTWSWGEEKWEDQCITINKDKTTLIYWVLPGKGYWGENRRSKDYYKRITRSDLRPNTDFLYE